MEINISLVKQALKMEGNIFIHSKSLLQQSHNKFTTVQQIKTIDINLRKFRQFQQAKTQLQKLIQKD